MSRSAVEWAGHTPCLTAHLLHMAAGALFAALGLAGCGVEAAEPSIDPMEDPGIVAECERPSPDWIWCDDFEQDRLGSYFEVVRADGAFARVPGMGVEGSTGMRARWGAGQVSAGNLKVAFGRTPSGYFRPVDPGTRDYREIYWRFFVRTEPGWAGGGYKLTRAIAFASAEWAEAVIGHLWTGASTTFLTLDPASGTDPGGVLRTTEYNDFPNLRWLGAQAGTTRVFDAARAGRWQCIEAHVRLNDAGAANGVFEFWVDGRREAGRADLNWVGSWDAYGINAVFLENYWNEGAPRAVERSFDNLIVSTAPVGCGA